MKEQWPLVLIDILLFGSALSLSSSPANAVSHRDYTVDHNHDRAKPNRAYSIPSYRSSKCARSTAVTQIIHSLTPGSEHGRAPALMHICFPEKGQSSALIRIASITPGDTFTFPHWDSMLVATRHQLATRNSGLTTRNLLQCRWKSLTKRKVAAKIC